MTRLREAMAQAVKAPEVIKTFETAGSPVAYHGRAGVFKIRRRGQRAAGRGGEEDRQGGVGNRASHFLSVPNVAWPHCVLTGSGVIAARNLRVISKSNRKDRTCQRSELSCRSSAIAIGGECRRQSRPRQSQEYRGTWEQQMACTPDVWRLCSDQIPDVSRIVTCLRQNTPQLSNNCRAVFESNAEQQQANRAAGSQRAFRSRRRHVAARRNRCQPQADAAPPRPYYDDDE